MKITIAILALASTASVLPSYADPTDAGAQDSGARYAIKFGCQDVVTLPASPARTMTIAGDTATHNDKTGVTTFSGSVKIVITEPGQAPVTITGNDLTLTRLK